MAALAGALGAALTAMVCRLTIGKKKYAEVEPEMQRILEQAEALRARFTELIAKDAAAFGKVMEAFSLPKETQPPVPSRWPPGATRARSATRASAR